MTLGNFIVAHNAINRRIAQFRRMEYHLVMVNLIYLRTLPVVTKLIIAFFSHFCIIKKNVLTYILLLIVNSIEPARTRRGRGKARGISHRKHVECEIHDNRYNYLIHALFTVESCFGHVLSHTCIHWPSCFVWYYGILYDVSVGLFCFYFFFILL